MKTQIIVQARLSSKRLPKKVLRKISGKYLIDYLIERLQKVNNSNFAIATSNKSTDNAISNHCINNSISCFRGSLKNVSKRMLDSAIFYKADYFVRINGDSPLIDTAIINHGINIFINGNYDLVTNVFPRSFPIGHSVEVIRTSSFKSAYNKMFNPDHFEHITKYYYENSSDFKIKNFMNGTDLSRYRFVVDSQQDLIRMRKIINKMSKPHYDYHLSELISLYPDS